METKMESDDSVVDTTYLLVSNVPFEMSSRDLRSFFSHFIHKNAFLTFHYQHTPTIETLKFLKKMLSVIKVSLETDPEPETVDLSEKETDMETSEADVTVKSEIKDETNVSDDASDSYLEADEVDEKLAALNGDPKAKSKMKVRHSCILRIKTEFVDSFISIYNKKFWIKKCGIILPIKCLIFNLTALLEQTGVTLGEDEDSQNMTLEQASPKKKSFIYDKIQKLKPLCTPPFMPQGNVATSLAVLKSIVEEQTELSFRLSKTYAALFLDANESKVKRIEVDLTNEKEVRSHLLDHPDSYLAVFNERGDLVPGYYDIKFNKSLLLPEEQNVLIPDLEVKEDIVPEVTEWEAFLSYFNDVSLMEKNREVKYMNEIEKVWKPDGPSLVFFVDGDYWRVEPPDEDPNAIDFVGEDGVTPLTAAERNRMKVEKLNLPRCSAEAMAARRLKKERRKHYKRLEKLEEKRLRKKSQVNSGVPPSKGWSGKRPMESYNWKEGNQFGRDFRGRGRPFPMKRGFNRFNKDFGPGPMQDRFDFDPYWNSGPSNFTPVDGAVTAFNCPLVYPPPPPPPNDQSFNQDNFSSQQGNSSSGPRGNFSNSYDSSMNTNQPMQGPQQNSFNSSYNNSYDNSYNNSYNNSYDNNYNSSYNSYGNNYNAQGANNYNASGANNYNAQGGNNYNAPGANNFNAQGATNYNAQGGNNYNAQGGNNYNAQGANNYSAPGVNNFNTQGSDFNATSGANNFNAAPGANSFNAAPGANTFNAQGGNNFAQRGNNFNAPGANNFNAQSSNNFSAPANNSFNAPIMNTTLQTQYQAQNQNV